MSEKEGLFGSRHQGRIRMILDGPDKGKWICYCLGCDWTTDPVPVGTHLRHACSDHEREANRGE